MKAFFFIKIFLYPDEPNLVGYEEWIIMSTRNLQSLVQNEKILSISKVINANKIFLLSLEDDNVIIRRSQMI